MYYEQTGRIDQAAMRAANISVDDMVYNYIYLNEWLYTRYALHPKEGLPCILHSPTQFIPPPPTIRLVTDVEAQIITVVDVGGLSMGGLSAQSLEFISKALGLVQAHYPARAQVSGWVGGWVGGWWVIGRTRSRRPDLRTPFAT